MSEIGGTLPTKAEVIGALSVPAGLSGSVTVPTLILAEIASRGPMGPPGPGAETYIHTQMVPQSIWIISHNLDRYPSVTIVDSAGTVVIGDMEYVTSNEIRVSFTSEFSGKAYLN